MRFRTPPGGHILLAEWGEGQFWVKAVAAHHELEAQGEYVPSHTAFTADQARHKLIHDVWERLRWEAAANGSTIAPLRIVREGD